MGMGREPDSPETVLRMLLARAGGTFADSLAQELDKQTFVGGRRVVRQPVPALPKQAATTVHVVKVNLYGARPPVWRRLEIPSVMTLDLVHQVLQAAFGWDDYHLHAFETVCGEFGDPARTTTGPTAGTSQRSHSLRSPPK
jgi:Plasmid pRiA4b ORF-3-like protein